jgi:calcineurin-like phosphoesterase family protein
MSTFFSSDFHGFHKNIVKGTSEWADKSTQNCRDFDTIEEHNTAILNGINSVVKENDILWFLGDFTFGGINSIWEFRKQIKCKNIHFIFGNHDHHQENNKILFNHPEHFTAQQIFLSTQYYKEITLKGQKVIMSHFPFLSWNHSSKGSIMLHGHEHSEINHLNTKIKRLDVGLDSAYKILGEYRPFSEEEILDLMQNRSSLILGNHK